MGQADTQLPSDSADPAEMARMHRRTKICIWIILIGIANFLAFVVGYSVLWGEALHGEVLVAEGGELIYRLQKGEEVSRGAFIYSGIHSISLWLTVGVIMLSMLTLAKERIASSMRVAILRGRTLITVLATIITISVLVASTVASLRFVRKFDSPEPVATEQNESDR
jgi:hypothetical protein